MVLKYTFKNELQYLEAWQYLMRLGIGFKSNQATKYIEVESEEHNDPGRVKERLDIIRGDND